METGATGSPHPEGLNSITQVEQRPREAATLRSMGRLVRTARLMARTNGGVAVVHLEPPTLGRVHLEIHVRERAITAILRTQTAQAHSLLSENLPLLRGMLERQGLAVERLEVNGEEDTSRGESTGNGTSSTEAQAEGWTQPRRWRAASPPPPLRRAVSEQPEEALPSPLPPARVSGEGAPGLDLIA